MIRLMIADESSAVRRIGQSILSDLGFTVVESESALDALHKCEAMLPRILLADATLPGCLELISNVRLLPGGQDVLIFYCITKADLRSLMAGKRAGASDYLLKPFDRKILSSVFANLKIAA